MASPPRTCAHSHTRRGIARGHLDYPSPATPNMRIPRGLLVLMDQDVLPNVMQRPEQSRGVRLPRRRKRESGILPSTPSPRCHPSVAHTSLLGVLRPGSFDSGCADVSPTRD